MSFLVYSVYKKMSVLVYCIYIKWVSWSTAYIENDRILVYCVYRKWVSWEITLVVLLSPTSIYKVIKHQNFTKCYILKHALHFREWWGGYYLWWKSWILWGPPDWSNLLRFYFIVLGLNQIQIPWFLEWKRGQAIKKQLA